MTDHFSRVTDERFWGTFYCLLSSHCRIQVLVSLFGTNILDFGKKSNTFKIVYLQLCGRADLMREVSKYQYISPQSFNYNPVNFRPSDLVRNTIILEKLDCINPVAIAFSARKYLLKLTPFIFIFLFINVF